VTPAARSRGRLRRRSSPSAPAPPAPRARAQPAAGRAAAAGTRADPGRGDAAKGARRAGRGARETRLARLVFDESPKAHRALRRPRQRGPSRTHASTSAARGRRGCLRWACWVRGGDAGRGGAWNADGVGGRRMHGEGGSMKGGWGHRAMARQLSGFSAEPAALMKKSARTSRRPTYRAAACARWQRRLSATHFRREGGGAQVAGLAARRARHRRGAPPRSQRRVSPRGTLRSPAARPPPRLPRRHCFRPRSAAPVRKVHVSPSAIRARHSADPPRLIPRPDTARAPATPLRLRSRHCPAPLIATLADVAAALLPLLGPWSGLAPPVGCDLAPGCCSAARRRRER